jgi:hypothetical protein
MQKKHRVQNIGPDFMARHNRRAASQVMPLFDDEPPVHLPSPDEIRASGKANSGFTKRTLASWGVPWPPPKGWRERLERQWHE